jgi:hypothetical protein
LQTYNLNELDQFAKHVLKAKHYFRYCDDFIIVHKDGKFLEDAVPKIQMFLKEKLQLELHSNKVEIRKIRQGVDFLGYITLPEGINVVRTHTKHRIVRKVTRASQNLAKGKITDETFASIISSYLGVLSHAREKKMTHKLRKITGHLK